MDIYRLKRLVFIPPHNLHDSQANLDTQVWVTSLMVPLEGIFLIVLVSPPCMFFLSCTHQTLNVQEGILSQKLIDVIGTLIWLIFSLIKMVSLEVWRQSTAWYGWWKSASVDAKQEQMLFYNVWGADTGSRLALVLSPRGSNHLAQVNLPGKRQNPEHLASNISCLKWRLVHFWNGIPFTVTQIKATP